MFSLSENHKKLILAFFIAVLLWTYASDQTSNIFNLGEEQAASFLVNIETRNLASEYEVESLSTSRAVVRVDYISYFTTIDKEDVRAYVDLTDVDPGDNLKIIEVDLPSGTRLMGTDPGYIIVKIREANDD
ncbi:hypothetical protein LJ207_06875 [Halanaerobium sp. Z-7514]|uniref:AMIN domain-containing protein n=1 Tax=Halanaerobium polyolivorans TaxID=2886943 RepID=A0AAW4WY81_9FIRM|nr:hypothetical protein [Halanaerobium polyolivorans]MCC3145043.1 hypothetical protein [Halanaerobium polyolivorans]RQD72495.1 MAG: hypothetical protein D5S01_09470 [Halanaerobium sp. MSAO_Bac5]